MAKVPIFISEYEVSRKSSDYYNEARGPILNIRNECSEHIFRFYPAFDKSRLSITASSAVLKEQYIDDNYHHFSITTKCKDVKYVVLVNQGTAAIRYQWFRNPPNHEAHKLLMDPTQFKSLRLGKHKDVDTIEVDVPKTEEPGVNSSRVPKKEHLEFHFSELPGIILPGQTLQFPVLFRSKQPGFFYETIYLLTHPRICTETGLLYSLNLTGGCVEGEPKEEGHENCAVQGLKRHLVNRMLEEESADLMESILHRALWNPTDPDLFSPSLVTFDRLVTQSNQPARTNAMELSLEERNKQYPEGRIKLFEELVCDKIEELLSTPGSCSNTIDWKPYDIVSLLLDPEHHDQESQQVQYPMEE